MSRLLRDAILTYWFGATDPMRAQERRELWFLSPPDADSTIREAFRGAWERVRRGETPLPDDEPAGALARCVLFDQFPRHMFRRSGLAFATDALARETAVRAIERGFDKQVSVAARRFFYLPLEHSESLADQERSVALFRAAYGEETARWAVEHHAIVARFSRFPYRNAALGRPCTPEEEAWLADPAHPRFGQ
jgi:uncharacterized protein (DUF924 family)